MAFPAQFRPKVGNKLDFSRLKQYLIGIYHGACTSDFAWARIMLFLHHCSKDHVVALRFLPHLLPLPSLSEVQHGSQ